MRFGGKERGKGGVTSRWSVQISAKRVSAAGHIGVKLESVVGAIRDRLDIRSIPLRIHIRGEKFRVVDNLCTWNQKKDEEKRRKTKKN